MGQKAHLAKKRERRKEKQKTRSLPLLGSDFSLRIAFTVANNREGSILLFCNRNGNHLRLLRGCREIRNSLEMSKRLGTVQDGKETHVKRGKRTTPIYDEGGSAVPPILWNAWPTRFRSAGNSAVCFAAETISPTMLVKTVRGLSRELI